MDPEAIIKAAPELILRGTELVAALKLTDVAKAILGPATGEFAERIHDSVRLYRFGRQLKCLQKAEKMARDAGFTPKAVPIKLLFPLLEGASLEEDEGLHTMWAALLANASSPEHAQTVRPGFIALLKQMASDEAVLLNWICEKTQPNHRLDSNWIVVAPKELGWPDADPVKHNRQLHACIEALEAAQLVRRYYYTHQDIRPSLYSTGFQKGVEFEYEVTDRGSEFIMACRPPKPK
jgi:hypothetical protein